MAVEDNQEPRENSVDRSRGARSESEEEMSADKEEPGPMSLDLDKLRAVRSAGLLPDPIQRAGPLTPADLSRRYSIASGSGAAPIR